MSSTTRTALRCAIQAPGFTTQEATKRADERNERTVRQQMPPQW